jgi:hypothetical protein
MKRSGWLVLEQHVDVALARGGPDKGRAEQEVRMPVCHLGIDEAGRKELERREVELFDEVGRQHALKLPGGIGRDCERAFEQRVVVAHAGRTIKLWASPRCGCNRLRRRSASMLAPSACPASRTHLSNLTDDRVRPAGQAGDISAHCAGPRIA